MSEFDDIKAAEARRRAIATKAVMGLGQFLRFYLEQQHAQTELLAEIAKGGKAGHAWVDELLGRSLEATHHGTQGINALTDALVLAIKEE